MRTAVAPPPTVAVRDAFQCDWSLKAQRVRELLQMHDIAGCLIQVLRLKHSLAL